jgi:hypothetical protein
MTQGEWLIVASTLLGPVLAVQAQKWVERARESLQRRNWIFGTLMATRQARVSFDHVRALNSIDLAFYGLRLLGRAWRAQRSQAVLDAWHDYHAHLSLPNEQRPKSEAEQRDWTGRGDELFTNLLDRLALAMHFKFERVQLKSGSYSPEAHGTVEFEQQAQRRLTIELLSGNRPLPMEVRKWHVDQETAERQKAMQAQIIEILDRLSKGHQGGDKKRNSNDIAAT